MNPAKSKVIGKVVHYTDILEEPIPKLLNEDDKVIDTGQIIIAQKLQVLKNDLLGIRVPKFTRWRAQITVKPTAKYVDECIQLQHAKAVTPLTEQKKFESA